MFGRNDFRGNPFMVCLVGMILERVRKKEKKKERVENRKRKWVGWVFGWEERNGGI